MQAKTNIQVFTFSGLVPFPEKDDIEKVRSHQINYYHLYIILQDFLFTGVKNVMPPVIDDGHLKIV